MIATLAFSYVAVFAAQADSISLAQALRNARERRGAVAVAAALVEAGRAQRQVAILPPNPTLQYTNKKSDPKQRLTFDQRLDWLLRWPSERAAGAALVDRAEAESAQRVANVAREVRFAFYGALAARDQHDVSRLQAVLADTLRTLAARRLDAGDISVVERDRFVLEAARARRLLLTARADYEIALAELTRATGSATTVEPRGTLADQLDAGADTTTVSLESIPRLQSVRADSVRSARLLSSARWSMVPMPSVFGGQEWDDNEVSGSTLIFGLAVPVPLWSQRREFVADAAAQQRRAAGELREARQETARLLSEARTRLLAAAQRARMARDTLVPTAQGIRTSTIRLYEAGRVSVLNVFESLRAEREVTITMIDDLLTYQRALADWYALLGRYE